MQSGIPFFIVLVNVDESLRMSAIYSYGFGIVALLETVR